MERRRVSVIAGAVLLVTVTLATLGWRKHATSNTLTVELRYRDVRGAEVRGGDLDPRSSTADLLLEITVRPLDAEKRGALFLFDREQRKLLGPVPMELGREGLRTVVALRGLSPRHARLGLVLVGKTDELRLMLDRILEAPTYERISEVAKALRLRRGTFDVRPPGSRAHYDSALLTAAEEQLARGELAAGLASVESLGDTLPTAELAHAAVVAAECAFGFGRTALARSFAEAGLAAGVAEPILEARLRRVQILAIAEGSDSTEPPVERERLTASLGRRSDALEAVLDAVLDLRLALLHDRFSAAAPRAETAARRVLELASQVQPEQRLMGVASGLCRAAERVAFGGSADGERALRAASALARASDNPAAMASCSIAAGDLFLKRSSWGEAEAAFDEARRVVRDRALPREQREAWYSTALLAERRGDLRTAFANATRAKDWVTLLLSLEVDLKAREQLLVNTAGYYAAAARFAALAGETAACIEISESSKGQAIAALLRGSSRIDGTALSPVLAPLGGPASKGTPVDGSRIAALATSLGARDAALSYTFLGMNARRRFEIAVGVVTRESTRLALVEQPDTFLSDVVELARAVEKNRADLAEEIGKRLYATLLEPIAFDLTGKDRLFISPHLRLHTLPWGALHDGTRFLVQRFAIARALPVLLLDRDVADDVPTFPGDSRSRWAVALNPSHAGLEGLPGLEPVFDQLPRRFPGTTLRSEQATARRLLQALEHSNALLFAGHASYDDADPLQSALFTASTRAEKSARPWPEDRVEARALLGLDRRLSLVILLGCETARLWRGKSSYGDEAIGLARAFLLAGARHVVGALWPVSDREAEDFLRAFASVENTEDPVRHVQRAQICLAQGPCPSRGIASWGSFLVDAH